MQGISALCNRPEHNTEEEIRWDKSKNRPVWNPGQVRPGYLAKFYKLAV